MVTFTHVRTFNCQRQLSTTTLYVYLVASTVAHSKAFKTQRRIQQTTRGLPHCTFAAAPSDHLSTLQLFTPQASTDLRHHIR
jgi:hypothetical protein